MQFTISVFLLFSTVLSFTSAYVPLQAPPANIPHRSLLMLTRQIIPTPCAVYSQTANYTFIGANSTIRAAFIQASPAGTDPTRSILDLATLAFKNGNMMFDVPLNTQCGNLSTLAAEEVNNNFTKGIVGPFKITVKKNGQADLVQTNSAAGREFGSLGLVFGMVLAGFLSI